LSHISKDLSFWQGNFIRGITACKGQIYLGRLVLSRREREGGEREQEKEGKGERERESERARERARESEGSSNALMIVLIDKLNPLKPHFARRRVTGDPPRSSPRRGSTRTAPRDTLERHALEPDERHGEGGTATPKTHEKNMHVRTQTHARAQEEGREGG
jgi:hypothetical protein